MNRKVLLIEPDYKNKYPPMGLMKIATYFRRCGDDVRFFKGDLKKFAAQLLCEEFYRGISDVRFGKYFPEMVEYIRTGKQACLYMVADSDLEEIKSKLDVYRIRYKNEDFVKFDFVGVTTLFTFYWAKTVDTVNFAKKFCKQNGRIMVGGIASTLQPAEFHKETGIQPHEGLLHKPGEIDQDNTDIIDELPLDYSILDEIEYVYPASNAYFGYMTRGCIRHCPFCAVKTLEPTYKDYIGIRDQLAYVDERFGPQKDLLLMDNNVLASKYFFQIVDEIKDCGFGKGATYLPANQYEIALSNLQDKYNVRACVRKILKMYDAVSEKLPEEESGKFYIQREERGLLYPITAKDTKIVEFDEIFKPLYNKYVKTGKRSRYIDFNQGVDARLITDEKMKKLSELNIRPLRIAFDHYEQKDIYCKAIRLAAKYGITELSNYLLYNFEDEPDHLYYRMRINVDLCEELDVKIYSFPMKFHPIFDPEYFRNRDYIGTHWNRKFIRAIQAILNSTKGKVGRGVSFFEEAFGRNIEEFHRLLWMPETFIIFRRKYDADLRKRMAERYTERTEEDCDKANEWWNDFCSLNQEQRKIAESIISKNRFGEGDYVCDDPQILHVLEYYKIRR